MYLMRMTASSLSGVRPKAHRGQQAPPHARYPAGQADADVTTLVAARIVTIILKIMIARMAHSSNQDWHFALNH
jgi:hypothetical protein